MLKVLTKGCEPTKGSKYSAAVDLYASEDIVIGAGETAIVGLGVCIDIDSLISRLYTSDIEYKKQTFMASYYLELHPRSSLAAKGLIFNIGIIDLDYKDEIKAIIHKTLNGGEDFSANMGGFMGFSDINHSYNIKKGDKLAQVILKEHKNYLFGIESEEECGHRDLL